MNGIIKTAAVMGFALSAFAASAQTTVGGKTALEYAIDNNACGGAAGIASAEFVEGNTKISVTCNPGAATNAVSGGGSTAVLAGVLIALAGAAAIGGGDGGSGGSSGGGSTPGTTD